LFTLHFPHQTRLSTTEIPTGLLKPAGQPLHFRAVRKCANLWQRELKVCRSALSYVNHSNLSNLGRKRVLTDNDTESDDDLPSLEELFRTPVPPSKPSTEASKIENTLEHLKHPAPDAAEILVDQTKSGLGERQGDSPGR
jgi:hypothetical protein